MKTKFKWLTFVLLLLVDCSHDLNVIKNNIEVVQGENTSKNAQNYHYYEITCCDQEVTLYEGDDISAFALEGCYLSDWKYLLTLKIKNELDVAQRLLLRNIKINNVKIAYEYQSPLYLPANEEETVQYIIDLRYTKMLQIAGLHVFNVEYSCLIEQGDRWVENNDVDINYRLIDMFDLDEYISDLDLPIITDDDVDIWYIGVEIDKSNGKKNLYFLLHNKTDDILMVDWENVMINNIDQNMFYPSSTISPHAYSMSVLSYEVNGYEYMNNSDNINVLVKVYLASSQAKELLNEYIVVFKTE